jgi:hypothetical protein
MSLARGPEVGLDAEVYLQGTTFESAAAPLGEVGGLADFGDAECVLVEGTRLDLSAGRHGKLNVIKGSHGHRQHPAIVSGNTRILRCALNA